jgi:hypothetical protein
MKTKKQKKLRRSMLLKIESRHSEAIVEYDKQGHVWVDSMTLALELEVSVFTWSGLLLPEVEKHYGDRNLFRRVRGRRALWDMTMIDRWYRQRKSPQRGFKARYIQKLEARGETAA